MDVSPLEVALEPYEFSSVSINLLREFQKKYFSSVLQPCLILFTLAVVFKLFQNIVYILCGSNRT